MVDRFNVLMLHTVSGEPRVSSVDLSESVVQDWSNGTVSTMGPAHLEQLYAEELSLFSASSGFKGRFTWRPVADARDTAGAMLLSGGPDDKRSSTVGILWATVDPADCTLQYEVHVYSFSTYNSYTLVTIFLQSPLSHSNSPFLPCVFPGSSKKKKKIGIRRYEKKKY